MGFYRPVSRNAVVDNDCRPDIPNTVGTYSTLREAIHPDATTKRVGQKNGCHTGTHLSQRRFSRALRFET